MLPDMAGISLLHVPLYSSIRREASSLDVLGRTRATLTMSESVSFTERCG